ncbi:MAG TPA: glycosyltransferase family 39 protein [Clostridia bacterium]|nr:glycosyltransferase family 39 protein [Clostridia bacterium]
MGNKRITLKRDTIAFLLIIAALIIIRLYHIDIAPLEVEESWRQADTESIARNFVQYKFNILYPNFNYDGPFPNVPALEFQITTFAIAILYKLFGFSFLWARLVPICFFMISAILLYFFAKKHLGQTGAIFSLIVYGTLPINVYYSRAIMPEAAGLMFFIGSLYCFDCWITSKRLEVLFLSSIFTALAIMTKPMTVFITIPMFYMLVRQYKWGWLLKKELWLFAFLALGLAFTYYSVSIPIADYKFSQGLAQNVLFKKLPTAITDLEAYSFIGKKLIILLTPAGIALAFLGLLSFNRQQSVILVWFAAMSLELVLVVTSIRINYYFIFFSVPCSILIGQGLAYLYGKLQTKAFSIILLMLFLLNSYAFAKPMYSVNTTMQTQVRIVQEYTGKEDLLIIGSLDPCLLSLSDRRGWRFNVGIYSNIPKDDLEELNYYIKNGAKYFVPIQGRIYKDENGEIQEYLDMNYERIEAEKGYTIYKLH